jgi:hypothetical protein
LYCDSCIKGKDINYCFEYHTDLEDVESLMETLLNSLNELYLKESQFYSIFNMNKSLNYNEQSSKVFREKNHLIEQLILIYIKTKLENFKEKFVISQENVIRLELREKIKLFGLFEIFESVFLKLIKCEVKFKIESLEFEYDKMILEDIIK